MVLLFQVRHDRLELYSGLTLLLWDIKVSKQALVTLGPLGDSVPDHQDFQRRLELDGLSLVMTTLTDGGLRHLVPLALGTYCDRLCAA